MVSGASNRAPALEMSPMPESTWSASTTSWSAPSMRTMRGARSWNARSMRVVHRSGGSKTCESDERMKAGGMGVSFPGPELARYSTEQSAGMTARLPLAQPRADRNADHRARHADCERDREGGSQ